MLHFKPIENNSSGNELDVRIYTNGSQLIVDLTSIDKETDLMVYNIMGKLVLQEKLLGEIQHAIDLNANMQILFVYLKNPDGSLTQKLLWGLY